MIMVRVRVKFPLFYSELACTDPWCNMLRYVTKTENIGEGNVRWTPSFISNKTNAKMCIFMYVKIQSDQPRITRNAFKKLNFQFLY